MANQLEYLFDFNRWSHIFNNNLFTWRSLANILDIVVVWFLVYQLIMLVKGTKAVQVVKGIAIIIVIRIVSDIIGLNTVSWIMSQVITYGAIAAIIIFQPEVRRGLEHLGQGSFFKKETVAMSDERKMVQAFDQAIQYMSRRKIGALITVQRHTSLGEYIETGIPLDADVTGELLINIFIPNTPLHDGAVIVRDNKIAVACAYLPLSESTLIPKEFGTRHRAAVGVSEVSDAVTIIVSEETGDVSLAINNRLLTHLSQEEYVNILKQELVHDDVLKKQGFFQTFRDNLTKGGKNK